VVSRIKMASVSEKKVRTSDIMLYTCIHAKFLVESIYGEWVRTQWVLQSYVSKIKSTFRFLTPLRSWPMLSCVSQTFFQRSSRPSWFKFNFNYILYMYMRTIAIFLFIHKPPSPLPVFLSGQGELCRTKNTYCSKGTLEHWHAWPCVICVMTHGW
jgi:hypothetical protein